MFAGPSAGAQAEWRDRSAAGGRACGRGRPVAVGGAPGRAGCGGRIGRGRL